MCLVPPSAHATQHAQPRASLARAPAPHTSPAPASAPQYPLSCGSQRAAAAKAAARQLLKLALDEGSTDDVTVVVNLFEWQDATAADSPAPSA